MADVMRLKVHMKTPFALSEVEDVETGRMIPFSSISFNGNVNSDGMLEVTLKILVNEVLIDEIEVYKTGVEKY